MIFNTNIPIYVQIIDDFKKRIISGEYGPSDKVLSVRDLAMEYGVNPNTVQKALSELERFSLVKRVRTSGRYITEDIKIIQELKDQFINEKVQTFITDLKGLSITDDEIIRHIERGIHNGSDD